MSTHVRGNAYRSIIVYINSYDEQILQGRLYHAHLPEGACFDSTMQFLLKLQRLLDEMDFPQSYAEVRRFLRPPNVVAVKPSEQDLTQASIAAFEIRILFRRNASWQGSLHWLDGRREEHFRSVLELVTLMDSALTAGEQEALA